MTSPQGLFQRGGSLAPAVVQFLDELGTGVGTLAQVLANGSDPDGNPVTGTLDFKNGSDVMLAQINVDQSMPAVIARDPDGDAGAALAVVADNGSDWPFFVTNEGETRIEVENGVTALKVIVGATLVIDVQGTAAIHFSAASFFLDSLPTADPHVAGQVWRNGTDLMVSVG